MTMKIAWQHVRLAAQKVCHRRDDAVRLTNLGIVSALAYDVGLVGVRNNKKSWNARTLRNSLDEIALSPLPKLTKSEKSWSALAQSAKEAASLLEAAGGPDQWVAAFQAADSGQKTRGAYATPSSFAEGLARLTLRPFIGASAPPRIVDPSAGAGALLIAALKVLGEGKSNSELCAILYEIYGVEADAASRELCCLLLWLNAARARPSLRRIENNVVIDNAITRNWWASRLDIFDALVMNPPWESLRHSVSGNDPDAILRSATIERLSMQKSVSPDLPPLFSAQGSGDRNLFKAFVELAPHLVRNSGRIGALIPAAFASDLGMAPLRARYFSQFQLESWTSFENLRRHFPIDCRYKFGVLIGTRSSLGTKSIAVRSFATDPKELESKHVILSKSMIARLGGAQLMLPELQDKEEAQVLSKMFEYGTPLFERGGMGKVFYQREVDLTLGKAANKFRRFDAQPKLRRSEAGLFHSTNGMPFVPLVEGRMVGRYDIFQKSWVKGEGRTAQWEMNGARSLSECTPQFVAEPRAPVKFRVAICDVTSATNTRTVHATLVPENWTCGNTAPVLLFESEKLALAGLAILNSLIFDWMARRIVGGLHLNRFYLATLVWPNLEGSAIERLSRLAAIMAKQSSRVPSCVAKSNYFKKTSDFVLSAEDYARTEADIEREVAIGFHLEQEMLRRILSADRSNRRGFWRYFSANPLSFGALQNLLDSYGHDKTPGLVSAVA
jgi:hypothetical protein